MIYKLIFVIIFIPSEELLIVKEKNNVGHGTLVKNVHVCSFYVFFL